MVPDVVGNPLERARERMAEAGLRVAAVSAITPPDDWKPRGPQKYETCEYVVDQRIIEDGTAVELITVQAWLPQEETAH